MSGSGTSRPRARHRSVSSAGPEPAPERGSGIRRGLSLPFARDMRSAGASNPRAPPGRTPCGIKPRPEKRGMKGWRFAQGDKVMSILFRIAVPADDTLAQVAVIPARQLAALPRILRAEGHPTRTPLIDPPHLNADTFPA